LALPPLPTEKAALRIALAPQLIFRALGGTESKRFPDLSDRNVLEETLTMAAAALAAI
jgi:hypothetical protein